MLSTIWILLRSVNTRILPALGNVTVLAAAVTSFVLGGTAAIVEVGRGFGVDRCFRCWSRRRSGQRLLVHYNSQSYRLPHNQNYPQQF